jgi:hypothetical protein
MALLNSKDPETLLLNLFKHQRTNFFDSSQVIPFDGVPYGDECVFVANDWHTALVPILLASKYRKFGVYLGARSLLCIHNLFHQGIFPPDTFNNLNLESNCTYPPRAPRVTRPSLPVSPSAGC